MMMVMELAICQRVASDDGSMCNDTDHSDGARNRSRILTMIPTIMIVIYIYIYIYIYI